MINTKKERILQTLKSKIEECKVGVRFIYSDEDSSLMSQNLVEYQLFVEEYLEKYNVPVIDSILDSFFSGRTYKFLKDANDIRMNAFFNADSKKELPPFPYISKQEMEKRAKSLGRMMVYRNSIK